MKVIVFYFMVLQNCLQIVLLQETQTSDNVTEDVSPKTNETSTNAVPISKDEINTTEVNKPHFESLNADPTHDEDAENNDVDYPAKTLMRLLKVKGSITDSFDQASKIFDGMQDVGGQLFGMVKDGALNVKNYLPFK